MRIDIVCFILGLASSIVNVAWAMPLSTEGNTLEIRNPEVVEIHFNNEHPEKWGHPTLVTNYLTEGLTYGFNVLKSLGSPGSTIRLADDNPTPISSTTMPATKLYEFHFTASGRRYRGQLNTVINVSTVTDCSKSMMAVYDDKNNLVLAIGPVCYLYKTSSSALILYLCT
ncbi:hypothetical protein C8J55DRAFT_530354 [Lentinula edodes]|uniref:Secreted protein n=1 Tax=Lentinula lateritia TaxID=40482 RepID=A0A9W9DD10_9AGAR|nr:hypothetical protein C8J55DRAFT_530354 [Lentinula edodes]